MNQIERPKNRFFSWFPVYKSKPTDSIKGEKKNVSTNFEAREEWKKKKSQMLAIGFGLIAMTLYAFAIGIIHIDIIKTDIAYLEKE